MIEHLATQKRTLVVRNIQKAYHSIPVRMPFHLIEVSQHLCHDYIDDRRVNHNNPLDILAAKAVEQRLLQRQLLFEKHLFVGIIDILLLLSALCVLI